VLEKKNEQIPHEIVSEESRDDSRVCYTIKVADDTFGEKIDEVLADLRKQVSLPGFRPGKAPVTLVKNRFGKHAKDEAVRKMVPRLAELVGEEKGQEQLGQPLFEGWESVEGGVELKVILEVKPAIEITDETLANIEVEVVQRDVDEARMEEELTGLQERNATFEASDDAAYERHDALSFDIAAKDPEGNTIPQLTVQGQYSENIHEQLPADLIDALVGKKKGESVVDLSTEIQNQQTGQALPAVFTVNVTEVKKRVLPALDDEFAKDVSEEFETLEDLKTKIRSELDQVEENSRRNQTVGGALSILRERLSFELPPTLVQNILQSSLYRAEQQMEQYGLSFKKMGREYTNQYVNKAGAEARVEAQNLLILDKIGDKFGIEASDEMMEAEIQKMADLQGRKPLAIRAQLEAQKKLDDFKAELRMRAVHDKLIELTTVKAIDKPKEEAESDSE